MFGSKLRSWMETHIVRPRKKGTKNKPSNDGGSKKAGTLPQNSHMSNIKSKSATLTTSPVLTSSGGSPSVIASPVRRREVSPIQCHTPSRYGWQSPDQDPVTSPKSDNLLYAPHCYIRHQLPTQQANVALQCKDNSSGDKSPAKVNCSSSSISSLSWSTGSKEPSAVASGQMMYKFEQQQLPTPPPPLPPAVESQSYAVGPEEEVEYEEVGALLLRPQPPDMIDYPRPRSENLASLQKSHDDSSHARYGRLLPSKLVTDSNDSLAAVQSECLSRPHAAANQVTVSRLRGTRGVSRSNLRTPLGIGMGAGPLHSLSSPESAYSTGYSTDGTSPCAANYNPPEYYINMRTGTHYFPKSVNSLAIEAQRYKFGLNRIEEMSPLDPLPKSSFGNANNFAQPPQRLEVAPSPLALNPIVPKLFESPSPRQRCRIRTNPWYSTTECAFGMQLTVGGLASNSAKGQRMELDTTSTTSTTSSGIKSSNGLEALVVQRCKPNGNGPLSKSYESSEGSSSSTEVENLHARTVKRRHFAAEVAAPLRQPEVFVASDDEEATLNEMIGKFDESYIYEKETDILSSDSDPTDCASELDTGQDAGDECDTDELLDIDFIDTSSIQEVLLDRSDMQRNLGSCYYYTNANSSPSHRPNYERKILTRSKRRNGPESVPGSGASQRRRKRFAKTRKKSCGESREKAILTASPLLQRPRESRSVGGTPVCLRRNPLAAKQRIYKTSPLSNRCNSLIFDNAKEKNFFTIAESEKALLKADLEADIKYRQLIMEAESLLESMKNSLQSIPRDTPVASPRRINPLANKRVEMLKNSEVESKKQLPPPTREQPHDLAAAINKRIELLKFETTTTYSAPNSPKMGRCSPRKTHLSNFMSQNAPPELPPRKSQTNNNNNQSSYKAPLSPQLQLNGRQLGSPNTARRMQSPTRLSNFNGSDSELDDVANHNYNYTSADHRNCNVIPDICNRQVSQPSFYCPHSEPLKRKVYSGSSFERIKKSFDVDFDMRQQTKLHGYPNDRQATELLASVSVKSSMHDVNDISELGEPSANRKQQLLVNTIVDLKRSLENQSYELNGLNEE